MGAGIADNELALFFGDEDVRPETVDAETFLRVTSAFLDLIVAASEESGGLRMRGVRIREGSCGIASTVDSADTARLATERAARLITDGARPPRSLGGPVRRAREAIRHLSAAEGLRAVVGGREVVVVKPVLTTATPRREWTTIRAEVRRVGGDDRIARFRARFEPRQFSLRCGDDAMAKRLGEHLYQEVEVEARLQRVEGVIVAGDVVGFTPVKAGDAMGALRAWFEPSRKFWDSVDDVEGEFARAR